VPPFPRTTRNRVTSARSLLHKIDGRTHVAKRYKDVLDNVIVEFDATTESDLALARRYASMSVFAEAEEARMARGEPHDAERLIRASNAQRRIRAALQASHKQRKRASKRNAP
jgi:predicted mannosyl-3-phosphoglycerate phosphatase (HAD superfamily)